MTTKEVGAAQDLTRELAKPGNFTKALDRYVTPTVKEEQRP